MALHPVPLPITLRHLKVGRAMKTRWVTGLLAILAGAPAVSAATLDVTAFGAVANDGQNDAAAIAAAIRAANSGDTVFLPAGTFDVAQTLAGKSGVNIVGAGRDAAVIRYI